MPKDNYPEQFYNVPKIHGQKEASIYQLKILTAIANELHSLRCDIEKVHNLNVDPKDLAMAQPAQV